MSEFKLMVDGREYSGWESIRITRGIERATSDFALQVSDRWASETDAWKILPGLACRILIDDDLVLTGWIDAFRPSYSATSHTVELTGRSKTSDFVDSSVTIEGGQMKGLTLKAIAELLAKPFKLEVVAEEEGDAIPETQVQQGETCFQLLERLARMQELLITDNADGALVLCRAGSKRASTSLRQGENILSASAELDNSQRFSEYIVKAQRAGNKTNDDSMASYWGKNGTVKFIAGSTTYANSYQVSNRPGEPRMRILLPSPHSRSIGFAEEFAADDADEDGDDENKPAAASDTTTRKHSSVINEVVGTAKDPDITRYRPMVLIAETEADDGKAENRADWEMRRRAADATKATVTVQGWHQPGGKLWASNLTLHVFSPWLAVDRDLIISEVELTYGTEGEICKLSLAIPDAFLPKKIRKAKTATKTKKGGGEGVDSWGKMGAVR